MRRPISFFQKIRQSLLFSIGSLGLLACSSLKECRPETPKTSSGFGCPVKETQLEFLSPDGKGNVTEWGNYLQSIHVTPDGKMQIDLKDGVSYVIQFLQVYKISGSEFIGPGWCVFVKTQQGEDQLCDSGTKNVFQEQFFTMSPRSSNMEMEQRILTHSGHFSLDDRSIFYLKNQKNLVVAFIVFQSSNAYDSSVKTGFPTFPSKKQATFEIFPLETPVQINNYDQGERAFRSRQGVSLFGSYTFLNYPSEKLPSHFYDSFEFQKMDAAKQNQTLNQFFQNELKIPALDEPVLSKTDVTGRTSYLTTKEFDQELPLIGVNVEKNLLGQTKVSGVRHRFYIELRNEKEMIGKLHLYRIFSKNFLKPQTIPDSQTEAIVLKDKREYTITPTFDCNPMIEVDGKPLSTKTTDKKPLLLNQ